MFKLIKFQFFLKYLKQYKKIEKKKTNFVRVIYYLFNICLIFGVVLITNLLILGISLM